MSLATAYAVVSAEQISFQPLPLLNLPLQYFIELYARRD